MKYIRLFEEVKDVDGFYFQGFEDYEDEEDKNKDIDPFEEEDWDEDDGENFDEEIESELLKKIKNYLNKSFLRYGVNKGFRIIKIFQYDVTFKIKKKKGKKIKIWDIDKIRFLDNELDDGNYWQLDKGFAIRGLVNNFDEGRRGFLSINRFIENNPEEDDD